MTTKSKLLRKTISAAVVVLALGGTALSPMSAMATGRHDGSVQSHRIQHDALTGHCGVNSLIPGGTLRGTTCRLR
jgi:hypothetical protein